MKKFYTVILASLILSGSVQGQIVGFPNYTSAGQPGFPSVPNYFDIGEFTLNGVTNTSNCSGGGSTTAINTLPASSNNYYSNYTNIAPYYTLIPSGSTVTWEIKEGGDGLGSTYPMGYNIWIDYNRNGAFEANEKVASPAGTITTYAGSSCSTVFVANGSFVAPNSMSVGPTLCRVILAYATVPTSATAVNSYGEVEDYVVFLGAKKWDYTVSKIMSPDSIAICGETPQTFNLEVKNVGNQPLTGGKIDCIIKGVEAGSTTSLFYTNTFTSTILDGGVDQFSVGPMSFPKDELLEFKFVISHPFDTLRDNDTLIKRIQVYKNPVFNLKSDTVCVGNYAKVAVINTPKPVFLKWDNEAITDTTSYLTNATQTRNVTVWRGWKCRADSTVTILAIQNPTLTVSNDTVLCSGQSTDLKAWHNGDTAHWPKVVTVVNTSGLSVAKDISSADVYEVFVTLNKYGRQCYARDTIRVGIAYPPYQDSILDTVCLGQAATIGLNTTSPKFLYSWEGRTETTPLINPIPTTTGNHYYYVHWSYEGCHQLQKVRAFVHPLPNVQIASTAPAICKHFSSTLTASGAPNLLWANGMGTSPSITVSPLQNTVYQVTGTDANGCVNTKSYGLTVHPKPDLYVYSNKRRDNVCLGDSVTLYSNGAKLYGWNGSTPKADSIQDSVKVFAPNQSFQYRVIGVNEFGCADTAEYRMTVKPPFNYSVKDRAIRGCEGEEKMISIPSGGIEYQWANTPGKITDTTANIFLDNTTKYQVTVTSPDTCDLVVQIPITVHPKPVIEVSSAIICESNGERATLEVKGGIDGKYKWSSDPSNFTNIESVLFPETTVVTVTGENEGGCTNEAYATVRVIKAQKVTFKSPIDEYICPTIPVTMVATPYGGVWDSDEAKTEALIQDNKFKIGTSTPAGSYKIKYTLTDPIHGCKTEEVKTVTISRPKCEATTNGVLAANTTLGWTVYPNPFREEVNIDIESSKNEKVMLNIYDPTGRIIYNREEKLHTGTNNIRIQNENWAKGIYHLEVLSETTSRQQSIVKE